MYIFLSCSPLPLFPFLSLFFLLFSLSFPHSLLLFFSLSLPADFWCGDRRHAAPLPTGMRGRSQTSYIALWGLRDFAVHTCKKTKVIQMRSWSLHVIRRFMHVNPLAKTAVDAVDMIHTWWTMKTQGSPIWAPCQDKNGAGFGISGVYLWVTQSVCAVPVLYHLLYKL